MNRITNNSGGIYRTISVKVLFLPTVRDLCAVDCKNYIEQRMGFIRWSVRVVPFYSDAKGPSEMLLFISYFFVKMIISIDLTFKKAFCFLFVVKNTKRKTPKQTSNMPDWHGMILILLKYISLPSFV